MINVSREEIKRMSSYKASESILSDKNKINNKNIDKGNKTSLNGNETLTEYIGGLVENANNKNTDIISAMIDDDTINRIENEDKKIKTRNGGGTGKIGDYMATLSEEERKAVCRKGGIASGAKRKARKTLGETLTAILSTGNNQDNLCNALFNQALSGDVKAFNSLRDTIGEMPTVKQEVTAVTAGDIALMEKVSRRLEIPSETDNKED